MSDPLETDTGLTIHDYKFLQGDQDYWSVGGAALWSVYEYCRNCGYGSFGDPTERGKKAIKVYENANKG